MPNSKNMRPPIVIPPDVLCKLTPEEVAEKATFIYGELRKRAYQYGVPIALFWFKDSGSIFMVANSHKLAERWDETHADAKVGSYGFVHRPDQPKGKKMIRPLLDRLIEDMVCHMEQEGV